ncbi:MaoC/PaaZ C-terminal domain-containing protein [Frankia tisae]|uniref:MaoC/PaaZ C-terminal domain-containing protein n=1 Tax=Frankia tisae TaxID=2950104 RepID=UPI0021C22E1E|nr:MaoC/PaaZ C-terminal domain-containing protein [Frankia tisae]
MGEAPGGTTDETIVFPIDPVHVMLFARAVGDDNPVYTDPAAAARAGLGGVPAPPTFGEALQQFIPGYPWRPRPDTPWVGSQRPGSTQAADSPVVLHAEQRYTYVRPVVAGETLRAAKRAGESWERTSARSGTLRFREIVTDFADEAGELVLRAVAVQARVGEGGAVSRQAPADRPGRDAGRRLPAGDTAGDTEGGASTALPAGQICQRPLVTDLSRAVIVQYAGASGDYNPLHHDEPYAIEIAGYPSVIAHGMLTMGITGRLVTDLVGVTRLREFGGRFRAPVFPGDSLSGTAAIVAVEGAGTDALVTIELATTNQRGAVVFTGTALVAGGSFDHPSLDVTDRPAIGVTEEVR